MFVRFRSKRDEKKRKEKDLLFLKNGASVLKEVTRTFNGDCIVIRSYSAEVLDEATSHFRWEIHRDWDYIVYKGIHHSVKIFKDDQLEKIANEVVIASRISNNKNVLKLLGCCLETELPMLVYEFPTMGSLAKCICRQENQQLQLPWEQKLRIVTEIADAIAYLHHGLPKTVIHRDIQPKSNFLDKNYTAKLFHFRDEIQVSEGETRVDVDVIIGTYGFVDPEVMTNGRYTEKSDVYGYGVLLCEVLTEKRFTGLVSSDGRLYGTSGEAITEYLQTHLQNESSNKSGQQREYAKLVQ